MTVESLLNGFCRIRKAQFGAPGADGQPTTTYVDEEGVRCRLAPGAGREYRVNEQNVVAEFICYLSGRVEITERDRIAIGSDEYDVRLVRNPSNASRHLECLLERVK